MTFRCSRQFVFGVRDAVEDAVVGDAVGNAEMIKIIIEDDTISKGRCADSKI